MHSASYSDRQQCFISKIAKPKIQYKTEDKYKKVYKTTIILILILKYDQSSKVNIWELLQQHSLGCPSYCSTNIIKLQTGMDLKCKGWKLHAFMMIFRFNWFGDGSTVVLPSTGSVSSMSPNTSRNAAAMFRCCGIVQWFSMESITG